MITPLVSLNESTSPAAIAAREMQLELSYLPIALTEARCKSLVRAAQELLDQWQALSRMQPTDEILAAFAEVRFVLSGFQGGANG